MAARPKPLQAWNPSQALLGLNDRFPETLGHFQGHLSAFKLQNGKLARDLNLEWRMQSIEDNLAKLHKSTRTGHLAALSRELLALIQHSLWHEMEKAVVEGQNLKTNAQTQEEELETTIMGMQSRIGTVHIEGMERRLTALEAQSIETASSAVTFAATEEVVAQKIAITTLIDRAQALEWKVNNLEKIWKTLLTQLSSHLLPRFPMN